MTNTLFLCTLFDSNYLSRGVLTYKSLKEVSTNFHLYILAFDDLTYSTLLNLNLENVTVIALFEFETDEMLRVKNNRTRTEYCWTSASVFTKFCINRYDLPHIVYIDADMYFYSDPSVLLTENLSADVMITHHRYSPRYDVSRLSGKYCVQWVAFRNTQNGRKILSDWASDCMKWCYNRHENGLFGDQKYLDYWPEKYLGIHEINNFGAGIAMWNIQQYKISSGGDLMFKQNSQKVIPVFYHYHYLKLFNNQSVELGRIVIEHSLIEYFYKPYIQKLISTEIYLKDAVSWDTKIGKIKPPNGLKHLLISFYRKLRNEYHIYKLKSWNLKYA
ncbi:MAG: glycosyltransferase [Saprospiraceae bacterium]